MRRTAVYEILIDGVVVYVGSSVNPKARMQAHRSRRQEFRNAAMRIVRWYASEAAARAAERRHIERANPVGNNSWNIARRLARAEAAYAKALDDYGIAFSADDADRPALNVKYQAKLNAISKRIAHCREVAVACKVSATTVYNHFPAREQEKLRKLGPTKRKN